MKQQTSPAGTRSTSPAIALGKARRLTRASFGGTKAEMIDERTYTLGG